MGGESVPTFGNTDEEFYGSSGFSQCNPLKLEFPRFDDDNPAAWIYKANQFYNYNQTPAGQMIFLASFHMEGDALVWFQDSEEASVFTSWEALLNPCTPDLDPWSMMILWRLYIG